MVFNNKKVFIKLIRVSVERKHFWFIVFKKLSDQNRNNILSLHEILEFLRRRNLFGK